jgi:hypothetical protein
MPSFGESGEDDDEFDEDQISLNDLEDDTDE